MARFLNKQLNRNLLTFVTQMNSLKINNLNARFSLLTLSLLLSFTTFAQSQVPDGVFPNTTDANGKKQGAWKKMDEQGTCVYVGQFKDDKPYGTFKYFDTDGRIMWEMEYRNGGTIAYAKNYSVTGKLQGQGKYVNQQKDSLWTFYTDEGVLLSQEWYKNGKKEGRSVTYHPGTKQPAEIDTFKNGLQEGHWIQYYLDGSKEAEGMYRAGNYEGRATWYFPDGKINIVGNYQHAVKDGKWVYYNPDGTVKGTEVWKQGKLISGEQVIKTEDFQKSVEDPQDANHNPGGDGPGGQ